MKLEEIIVTLRLWWSLLLWWSSLGLCSGAHQLLSWCSGSSISPPVNASTHHATHKRLSCVLNVLIDPQRSATDWTDEKVVAPICLWHSAHLFKLSLGLCVMFPAVALSRWSVPQVTTQSWWVTEPVLTATYTFRPASSLPPTHSWSWAVITYPHTHTLIQRRAAISMLWCMGCHGCLVGGEVEEEGPRLLSQDDGASPLTGIYYW